MKTYWKVKIAVFGFAGDGKGELYFRKKEEAENFYKNTPNPADAPQHINVKKREKINAIEEAIYYQENEY